ncbi:MAG: hypothetical protein A2W97_09180 [Bacteroidetes bacterium GWE2_40_63]|nr:MAG: hypothetical protein A2W97_09180 [Bacteroidetes bacterium GWE2_40_63]OFY18054.1 MAG: hypothetical protein A2W88_18140 [Bacteroidetes bacterium GWF2_40_13]OFZ30260.1 MAG: hypothetical protein A2437_05180 [Bacteroidetes bacterium RIFOXYC2_FULL_40_12]HBX83569.1 hypothetical protein [Marinilabiliales bacterium]HBY51192.1 hypothetical protein [Marinilabiliales bacterium]
MIKSEIFFIIQYLLIIKIIGIQIAITIFLFLKNFRNKYQVVFKKSLKLNPYKTLFLIFFTPTLADIKNTFS